MAPAMSKYENLKTLTSGTAKFATWLVRIIDPTVKASKLQCILVSANEKQYMAGLGPFSFRDRKAA